MDEILQSLRQNIRLYAAYDQDIEYGEYRDTLEILNSIRRALRQEYHFDIETGQPSNLVDISDQVEHLYGVVVVYEPYKRLAYITDLKQREQRMEMRQNITQKLRALAASLNSLITSPPK